MPSRSLSIQPPLVEENSGACEPRRAKILRRLLRVCARRPLDTLGCAVMLALSAMIIGNALFRQQGPELTLPHGPKVAPKSARETTGSLIVMPRPRPAETAPAMDASAAPARPRAQIVMDMQRELQRRGFYEGAIDGILGPKMEAAQRDFAQAAGLRLGGEPDEAQLKAMMAAPSKVHRAKAAGPTHHSPPAVPAQRISAVQRALSDFGYGQIKVTGALDAPTRSALEKFERDHKMPVTGQVSERLLHELAAATGRSIQ